MHAFDKDTEFIRKSDGVNNVTVSDQWSINHIPNGGYTMALLTRAMIGDDNALVSCIATANYMERCDPEPGQIFVETIGETKNIIHQEENILTTALLIAIAKRFSYSKSGKGNSGSCSGGFVHLAKHQGGVVNNA